jgi:hypothetical protein
MTDAAATTHGTGVSPAPGAPAAPTNRLRNHARDRLEQRIEMMRRGDIAPPRRRRRSAAELKATVATKVRLAAAAAACLVSGSVTQYEAFFEKAVWLHRHNGRLLANRMRALELSEARDASVRCARLLLLLLLLMQLLVRKHKRYSLGAKSR